MLRVPKEMEGRKLCILLAGVPTQEVKVTKINDDEIIGEYSDGEEIHVSHNKIMAWWITKRQPMSKEARAKLMKAKKPKDSTKDTESPESIEEETDTPIEKEE